METSPTFLFEHAVPRSDFAVLVGFLREGDWLWERLGAFRRILWFVAGAEDRARLLSGASEKVEVVDILGLSRTALEELLDAFVMRSVRTLPSVFVTHEGAKEDYAGVVEVLFPALESHYRARVTRQQDAVRWQMHLVQNTRAYAYGRLPEGWAGSLSGMPAMVVGAGPSLETSGSRIAEMADRGVIFSADSAVRRLTELGVEPDFLVSVDVAKVPEKCLPEGQISGRVILSLVSPPSWQTRIEAGRRFFLESHQVTQQWLFRKGIPGTRVSVCENCGVTALELARFLGCSPIYLLGMDLSLDPADPSKRHQGGADPDLYVHSGFSAKQRFPMVPGNFQTQVPTHVYGDWRALNERLRGWPEGLVWVVSDRGARLANTQVIRPSGFRLPEQGDAKQRALKRLEAAEAAEAVSDEILMAALAKYREMGARIRDALPDWRRDFRIGGAGRMAALWVPWVTGEDALLLGAFAFKLMPHLMPPLEEDVRLWEELLLEWEALGKVFSGVELGG